MRPQLKPARPAIAIGLAMIAALLVSACVTVFPETKPAALYRFTGDIPAGQAAANAGRISIIKGPTAFTRSAATDRILTVNGANAAYIAGSRWLSPASTLFDEAVDRAFQANQGAARLGARGDLGLPNYVLRLNMQTFETRYLAGPEAAPTVTLRMTATLQRVSDRSMQGTQSFAADVPATENRVTAIVAAYDQATTKVLTELMAWLNGVR